MIIQQALRCKKDNKCDKCPLRTECIDGLCIDLSNDLIDELVSKNYDLEAKANEYDKLIEDFICSLVSKVSRVLFANRNIKEGGDCGNE